MTYGRSIWLAALTALLVLGSACGSSGDDDGDDSTDESPGGGDKDSGSGGSDDEKDASPGGGGGGDDDPPASGGSGTGGSSSEGGSGGDITLDAGMVDSGGIEVCGAETCADPMCCADAFASKCGVKINARACLPPAPPSTMSDERCPSVSIMNGAFMIPSCCTDDGKCGIDAAAAGMGCISLEEVIAFSSRMQDGGMTGGGVTSGIMWPEPKACN